MCKTGASSQDDRDSVKKDLTMVDISDPDTCSALADDILGSVARFLAGGDFADCSEDDASASSDHGNDEKVHGTDHSDASDQPAMRVLRGMLEETAAPQKKHRRKRGRRAGRKGDEAERAALMPPPGVWFQQATPVPAGAVQPPPTPVPLEPPRAGELPLPFGAALLSQHPEAPGAPQVLQLPAPAGATLPSQPPELQQPWALVSILETQQPQPLAPDGATQQPWPPSPQRLHLSEMILNTKEPKQSQEFAPEGRSSINRGLLMGQFMIETMRRANIPRMHPQQDLARVDMALHDSIKHLFHSGAVPTVQAVQQCLRARQIPEDLVCSLPSLCALPSSRYCFWVPDEGDTCIVCLDAPLDPLPSHTMEDFEMSLADVFAERLGLATAAACSQVLPPQTPPQLAWQQQQPQQQPHHLVQQQEQQQLNQHQSQQLTSQPPIHMERQLPWAQEAPPNLQLTAALLAMQ